MKALLLNYSDLSGGAARAAYRIHHALRAAGVDSQMRVNASRSGDQTIRGPMGKWAKGVAVGRSIAGDMASRLLKTSNPVLHSPAVLPSAWPNQINASDVDVVHLHWMNGEMLSVEDIGKIRKPIAWTLHDMWAFCGAEHYTEGSRWAEGYARHNRPSYESRFDLNRWTWQRKRKAWTRPLHVVAPSRWLAECVRRSALMKEWPVRVVHNPLDTEVWCPVDKKFARQLLGLPDGPLLLFGAIGGRNDPRKGFDLLRSALQHLRGEVSDLRLLVFGQLAPSGSDDLGFPVHYMGHLHDDLTLRVLYSAADVLVIPSRQEAFGQTASEANACGTPAVGFDNSGVSEIVTHYRTGYLAKAFDAEDLAQGIKWVLADRERHSALSARARQEAVAKFSYPVVAAQYCQVYKEAIDAF